MRLRSIAFATLPAAAVIAFAAGCGSGSSGSAGAAAPASVAPATSAPAAASGSGGGPYGSGGGAATSAATTGSASGEITLHIQNFMFGAVTVPAGAKVEVENEDTAPHTVNVHGAGIDVQVAPGGKATFTAPAKAGSYALTCDIHPNMHGSLVVS